MPIDRNRLAIVGATGLVGREALRILQEWGVPPGRIIPLASAGSAGTAIEYGDALLTVRAYDPGILADAGVAVLCVSSGLSRRITADLEGTDVRLVDASSAFRMREDVPLVIPEVNGSLLEDKPRLVASPNCSTILLLTALEPIRRRYGIEAITVSTYQAVSGAGREGVEELFNQTLAVLGGSQPEPVNFPEPIAFNCFSHESEVDPVTGLNGEEQKIIAETRKIWNDDSVRINPTCVRVPVERSHSESVTVTLRTPATTDEHRAALEGAESVRVVDDPSRGCFPTPRQAGGIDDVLVGRLRTNPGDSVDANGRSLSHVLWLSGDQLRKGAALNALQIARLICPTLFQPAQSPATRVPDVVGT